MGEPEKPQVNEPQSVQEETKELTLAEVLREKYRDYELLGNYGEKTHKTMRLKRWPYAVAVELVPMSIDVFLQVMSSFSDENRLLNRNDTMAPMLMRNLQAVGTVLAKTLALCREENGFASQAAAQEFVGQLEVADVIGLCRVVADQNLGHLGKKELIGVGLGDLVKAKARTSLPTPT